MKTLVIDTAFEQCQIGIWNGTDCLSSVSVTGGGQHDRVLVPLLQQVLQESGVALSELNRIFVTTGPGRFTGLRVGIAFARGLALVNETPLYGVSTIDALEYDVTASGTTAQAVAVTVAVKRGESYIKRLVPQPSALLRVMDDDFADFFSADEKTLLAGVISPEIVDVIAANPHISRFDTIAYPSLDAIFATGNAMEYDPNTPVRPHYALD